MFPKGWRIATLWSGRSAGAVISTRERSMGEVHSKTPMSAHTFSHRGWDVSRRVLMWSVSPTLRPGIVQTMFRSSGSKMLADMDELSVDSLTLTSSVRSTPFVSIAPTWTISAVPYRLE